MDNRLNINTIKIVQLNLQNCIASTPNLVEYALSNNLDIILYQDIYRKNNMVVGYPAQWRIFTSLSGSSGIFVLNNSLLCLVKLRFDNSVFINIQTSSGSILLGSIYSSPTSDLELDVNCWANDLWDRDAVIAGDYNAKSRLWGYSRTDQRGEIILDLSTTLDYKIMNNPNDHPTYHLQGRYGYPDLTIATNSISNRVINWKVDLTDSCSDHRFVRFEIRDEYESGPSVGFNFSHYSKSKLNSQIKELENELIPIIENCNTIEETDDVMNNLYLKLNKICNDNFKKKKLDGLAKLRWWNGTLRSQRSKVGALYKKHKRNPTDQQTRIKYYKEKAIYKIKIKDSKNNSWRQFCTNNRDKFEYF